MDFRVYTIFPDINYGYIAMVYKDHSQFDVNFTIEDGKLKIFDKEFNLDRFNEFVENVNNGIYDEYNFPIWSGVCNFLYDDGCSCFEYTSWHKYQRCSYSMELPDPVDNINSFRDEIIGILDKIN